MIRVAWDLEEMVALVDLFMRTKKEKPSVRHQMIEEFSIKLRIRAESLNIKHDKKFRNHAGVSMMLMNLSHIASEGVTGLSSTSKLAESVWAMYHNQPDEFQRILSEFNVKYDTYRYLVSPHNEDVDQLEEEPRHTSEKELQPEPEKSFQQKPDNAPGLTHPKSKGEKTGIVQLTPTLDEFMLQHSIQPDATFGEQLQLDPQQYQALSIEDLSLTVRALNCLRNKKIETVDQILVLTPTSLMTIKKLGKTSFFDIWKALSRLDQSSGYVRTQPVNMLSLCEELLQYREQIKEGDWQFLSSTTLSDEGLKRLSSLRDLIEALGNDLFDDLVSNYAYHIGVLLSISASVVEQAQFSRKLSILFSKIPKERHTLRVSGFVFAYCPSNENQQETLYRLFGSREALLSDILTKSYCEDIADQKLLTEFLEWCAFDITVEVQKISEILTKDERYPSIIRMRSENKTLNDVGLAFNLTRERIRQIEAKVLRKVMMQQRIRPFLLKISALRNGDSIISPEELNPYLGEDNTSLLYLLRYSANKHYTYNKKFKVFMIGHEGVDAQVEQYVDSLPESFNEKQLASILQKAEIEHGLPEELVAAQIEAIYTRYGNVYSQGRLSLSRIYDAILRKHYPHGLHVYDPAVLQEFRQHVLTEYGEEVKMPDSDRALSARIADIGILCGRGEYRSKRERYISGELAAKLHQFISKNESPILLMNTIFAEFECDLLSEGVDNKYYLQGILGELFSDEFYFSRDYVSRNPSYTSLYPAIVDYIRQFGHPVSKESLFRHFKGVPDIVVTIATSDSHIVNFFGEYMHIDQLAIRGDDRSLLFSHLNQLLSDKQTHTSRELYVYMAARIPQVLKRYFIQFHFALFSLCECLFGEDFAFTRPYLARHGVKLIKQDEILINYLNTTGTRQINQLIDSLHGKQVRIGSTLDLLDDLNEEYLILDHERLVSISEAGITEEIALAVETAIIQEVSSCRPIRDLLCIYRFPTIAVHWTEWLIYSVLKKWSTLLEVRPSFRQFRFSIPLVAPVGTMTEQDVENIGMVMGQDAHSPVSLHEDLDELYADILLEEGDYDEFS